MAENIFLITDRIEEFRTKKGLNKTEFCQSIGYSVANYSQTTGPRGSKPSVDLVSAVVKNTEVNPAWLLTGEGPMMRGEVKEREGLPEDVMLVPALELKLSAGAGAYLNNTDEDVVGMVPFRRSHLRRLTNHPDSVRVMTVIGDSMIPLLQPGCWVAVDTSIKRHVGDGVYAVRIDDVLMIKRLARQPGGAIRVTSDNPVYPPFEAPKDDDLFAILGRVVEGTTRY